MSDSLLFDTSDDEELREQLDMHSIIVSCINDEPLFTADQVQKRVPSIKEREPRLQNHFLVWPLSDRLLELTYFPCVFW